MKIERRAVVVFAIGAVVLFFSFAGLAFWRAQKALNGSEQELAAADQLSVTAGALSLQPNPGFESMAAPAVFKSGAAFNGKFYLAGPAGLFVYSLDGALEHIYIAGLELPAAPLGQMAVGTLADARQPELLIATRGDGVLAFNGQNFRQIRPADPELRAGHGDPSARLWPSAPGNSQTGLLVYDGKSLRRFHPTTNNIYVTALAGTEAELWIGTLDRGILALAGRSNRARSPRHRGFPMNASRQSRADGDRVYVGTPLGVAEIRSGKVARVLAAGPLRPCSVRSGKARSWSANSRAASCASGSIRPTSNPATRRAIDLRSDEPSPGDRTGAKTDPSGAAGSPVEQFLAAGDSRYAVTGSGLLQPAARRRMGQNSRRGAGPQ